MFTIVKLELLVHPNLLRFRGHGGPTLYTLHPPRHLPSSWHLATPLTQSARALKISPFPRWSRYPSGRNEGFSDAFVANHGISRGYIPTKPITIFPLSEDFTGEIKTIEDSTKIGRNQKNVVKNVGLSRYISMRIWEITRDQQKGQLCRDEKVLRPTESDSYPAVDNTQWELIQATIANLTTHWEIRCVNVVILHEETSAYSDITWGFDRQNMSATKSPFKQPCGI